jgi:hypothetical protein
LAADVPPIAQNPTSPQGEAFTNAVDCTRRALIPDLFAESITIALGFGLNCLRAAQYGDDAAAIGEFRGFRAAAQTAGECCKEPRGIVESRA